MDAMRPIWPSSLTADALLAQPSLLRIRTSLVRVAAASAAAAAA